MADGIDKLPSGSWRARYVDDAGKRHSKTFKKKADAANWIIEQKRALLHGEHVAPSDARTLFGDWLDEWWRITVHLRPNTEQSYSSLVESRIRTRFGKYEIGRINQPMVKRWVSELDAEGLAPSTVEKLLVIFGSIMRAAQEAGLIAKLPTQGVKKPSGERREMRFLVPDEIKLLAETIDPRFRAFVFFGAYCGLRLGEMFALRRENLDLFRGSVKVVNTLSEPRGELLIGPPKTRASRRSVPIPRSVARELSEHLAAHVPADEPFVFPALRGGPQRPNAFRQRVWAPAVKAAGLAPLRIHDLRHTAVSLWLAAGDDPVTVARRAGHTSTVTVLDVYGHLIPQRGKESMRRLEDVFDMAKTTGMAKVVNLRRR